MDTRNESADSATPAVGGGAKSCARDRLDSELAALPAWSTPALWAHIRGERDPRPSLGAMAYLLAEARRREQPDAAREIFTRILTRVEHANRRWAAALAQGTSSVPQLAAYAVQEDLCQELALRLWQRLALDCSPPWQVYFWRALDFERQHVAEDYMRRNGHWVRSAWSAALRRVPHALQQPCDDVDEPVEDARLSHADLIDVRLFVLRLPPRERTAVVLRFWAGAKEAEIGAILGVTPRTVRGILRRACARLRTLYEGGDE